MGQDYIPTSDPEAIAEGRVRVNYALANLADLDLTTADVTPLEDALDAFETDFNKIVADKATLKASIKSRDASREGWEKLDRDLNATLARADAKHRAAMHLNVRDTVKTDSGAVTSHPLGTIDWSQKLRHELGFRDSDTPDSKAKPKNAAFCDIWYKIGGDPPAGFKECEQAGIDSSTPYLMQFDEADANKTVYYLMRWIAKNGTPGAWSPMFSGTITN